METKAYKRLISAAVEAADRLQRAKLKTDREAGDRLLLALADLDSDQESERKAA